MIKREKEWKKIDEFLLNVSDEKIAIAEVMCLANIYRKESSYIIRDFQQLSETFDVNQRRMAMRANIEGRLFRTDSTLRRLVNLQETAIEKAVEAIKKSEQQIKIQRKRLKISTLIAIIAISVAIVLIITRFLV
jgi:hypothetical protein